MEERKIEAWTGPIDDDGSTMIGALIQGDDGFIEQMDDSLREALKGHVPAGSPDLAADLLDRLHNSGYPNATLDFPWEVKDE